ncbi:dethiobiotin synthase [Thalassotalea sp. M1531]|uniref:ATP-dependent dethiobiotin synthetase BioD n=1 Tax=Thalassotalea algicola TaxID=2716224 RepID=A0A7Y0LFR1_9GAMM|nr:dethiobiotin synthase [Thalassotalea algicola]NMP32365.1 dethiobiotin synthase [Thalassotalea algicola]
MTKRIFITATDTDAGKTLISSALTFKLSQTNKVACFKPVSAGCQLINGQLVNDDAKILMSLANCQQSLNSVNPIAFKEPIAPHIAAQQLNVDISLDDLTNSYNEIIKLSPDVIITEGAGGWRLPLGNSKFLSDFAIQTKQQIILVINLKLGCLNHALLTYESIISDGLTCVGWIGNCIEPMPFAKENIAELSSLIPVPCLGVIPKIEGYHQATEYINLP